MDEEQIAYRITLLGFTSTYIVIHVVLCARLAEDAAMQQAHNAELTAYVTPARAARRKLWMAIDISRLTADHSMRLFYLTVLPLAHLPIISKGFGKPQSSVFANQREAQAAHRLMSVRFQHELVADLAAALPPEPVAAYDLTTLVWPARSPVQQ